MIPKVICFIFGHNPDSTEVLLELIKQSAISKHERKPVYCQRCGKKL